MHGESKEHAALQEKGIVESETDAVPVQAQHPLSEKEADEENVGVVPDKDETKLPFSKARCIALVLTVTCAAILNVSQYPSPSKGVLETSLST